MSKSTKNILTTSLFFVLYLVLREFVGFEFVVLMVLAGLQADNSLLAENKDNK